MSDLIIRPLRPNDRPVWEKMWSEYLTHSEDAPTSEVIQTAFERLMRDDPHEPQGLLAEREGQVVGLAHFLFHRMIWSVEDTCFLMDVYTTHQARGTGAGRALIEAVHAAANANGIPDIYWHARANNTAARTLYDKIATLTTFVHYEKRS